ncbi:MAG: nucleoside triphosphate pyrophosphatase [Corynebacterium sp.]|nr:nucleoside triphosphate pyrophosphatase [Corynebacterium sp.]
MVPLPIHSNIGPRFILASGSTSRSRVLRSAGITAEAIPPDVDEEAILAIVADQSPTDQVLALARAKAERIATNLTTGSEAVVIGCDSMLLRDGKLSGKPHTEKATIAQWRSQAGTTAELITGHCILAVGAWAQHRLAPDKRHLMETVSTTIHFGTPSEEDIRAYAQTGEPWGCAGAFTMEALGGWFIDTVEGDPSSVLGISLPLVRRALYQFGLSVSHFW